MPEASVFEADFAAVEPQVPADVADTPIVEPETAAVDAKVPAIDAEISAVEPEAAAYVEETPAFFEADSAVELEAAADAQENSAPESDVAKDAAEPTPQELRMDVLKLKNPILALEEVAEPQQTPEQVNGADVPSNIWDIKSSKQAEPVLEPEIKPEAAPDKMTMPEPMIETPDAAVIPPATMAASQVKRRAGRVKTRLLGFDHASQAAADPFDPSEAVKSISQAKYPVGWIVVVDGPGRGESFALQSGMSQIGRGDDQAIKLDFGDASISRNNHAAIVYDVESHKFLLGHGGKANVVRLNDKPLLNTGPNPTKVRNPP